ncbi:hypothetical protein QBC32DRAFT_369079 [Pseudoneurospora amorphoporcata]|uniref:Uncharacterized protein n=1 Tax=Pseudoneurospora amorphoporcata TaxID=241081 RepID=A0AAN6NXT0_9PEZI|nr:hypothetical protein QBC32DRAFT_369079 [Pseudoneurospora amorphoporcata]
MSDRFHELRTARKEGVQHLHRSTTSIQIPDRFNELRSARREGRPLHRPNISKKRDGAMRESHHVETYCDEGATELYPKGDSPLVDALRRRSRSSPPPRNRAPSPHPRASGPAKAKKTVQWADPLEQPTPEGLRVEKKGRESEKHQPDQMASSLPRPKRNGSLSKPSKSSYSSRRPSTTVATIKVTLTTQDRQSPQRPPSPLISQAVITLSPDSRHLQQRHVAHTTHEKPSSSQPPSVLYLKEKPRRAGTIRPRSFDTKLATAAVKKEFTLEKSDPSRPSVIDTRSDVPVDVIGRASGLSSKIPVPKNTTPSSASGTSFHATKGFWSGISSSNSCGATVDGAEPVKIPCGPFVDCEKVCKPSKMAQLSECTVNQAVNVRSSSICTIPVSRSERRSLGRHESKSRIPVPSAPSYHHVTKTQQSRYVPLRAISGVEASGSLLKPPTDARSTAGVSCACSNSPSFHMAESHLGIASDNNVLKTEITALTTPLLPSNDSMTQPKSAPPSQSELCKDILNLCISESSTCPQDCDCDNCTWSGLDGVDHSSTVACLDGGEGRRR